MSMKEERNWTFRASTWKKDILEHKRQLVLSIILIIMAVILNFISASYTEKAGSASPPDLILDHLPFFDLSIIYIGFFPLILGVFIFYTLIFKPAKLHYMLGLLSLYGVVKAGFSALTHLKIPNGAVDVSWTPFFYDWFAFSNYLFFAGNVGLAYLGYLMYRENKVLKYFMLVSSFVLAASALLMHRHYTIDVISAYFITYGVYKLGHFIFKD